MIDRCGMFLSGIITWVVLSSPKLLLIISTTRLILQILHGNQSLICTIFTIFGHFFT